MTNPHSASVRSFTVPAEAAGSRLDAWLTAQLEGVSRSRVKLLLDEGQVSVDGAVEKASLKLRGGETVEVVGEPEPPPLRAIAEDIPLRIVHEDKDLVVIDKPAGMMVHAGSGATDSARNQGTLVNALLGHYQKLSQTGGSLRPGIVHRLDKQTSGLIIVARNDAAHLKLAEMFSQRAIHKTYVALVHGHLAQDRGTINAAIARDMIRRTRMTTRRTEGARAAISHYRVERRIDSRFGKFTLVSVKIETGRTHQIRVHLSSIGHPVVGDTHYGAPAKIVPGGSRRKHEPTPEGIALPRNFLHAAELRFEHPRTGKELHLEAPLPEELTQFLRQIEPLDPA
jgi:23S rRNA pseudouridine1911/1915/1917 synthase